MQITDEAVVAAAKAVSLDWQNYVASMRTALEAAAPLLAPRPASPDRREIMKALLDFHSVTRIPSPSIAELQDLADTLQALPSAAPQPVVDREALRAALLGHQLEWVEDAKTFDCSCNEDGALDWMPTITEASQHQVDAVLALINGTAK